MQLPCTRHVCTRQLAHSCRDGAKREPNLRAAIREPNRQAHKAYKVEPNGDPAKRDQDVTIHVQKMICKRRELNNKISLNVNQSQFTFT